MKRIYTAIYVTVQIMQNYCEAVSVKHYCEAVSSGMNESVDFELKSCSCGRKAMANCRKSQDRQS